RVQAAPGEDDVFIGVAAEREARKRVFGGQWTASALMAAGRTVPEGSTPHSLHGYFIRAGAPDSPIRFEVERTRDGRTFQTRRVVARQEGRIAYVLQASFHKDEPGFEHQLPTPEAPDADGLATFLERHEPY